MNLLDLIRRLNIDKTNEAEAPKEIVHDEE